MKAYAIIVTILFVGTLVYVWKTKKESFCNGVPHPSKCYSCEQELVASSKTVGWGAAGHKSKCFSCENHPVQPHAQTGTRFYGGVPVLGRV